MAEAIVQAPLVAVGEDRVGLGGFLEFFFGELRKGYTLNDRLLRPAMVKVAKA